MIDKLLSLKANKLNECQSPDLQEIMSQYQLKVVMDECKSFVR